MAKVNYRDRASRLMGIVSGAMERIKDLSDELTDPASRVQDRDDDYIAMSLVSSAHSQLASAHTALSCVSMLPVAPRRRGVAGE